MLHVNLTRRTDAMAYQVLILKASPERGWIVINIIQIWTRGVWDIGETLKASRRNGEDRACVVVYFQRGGKRHLSWTYWAYISWRNSKSWSRSHSQKRFISSSRGYTARLHLEVVPFNNVCVWKKSSEKNEFFNLSLGMLAHIICL